jgi:hypothetical protein
MSVIASTFGGQVVWSSVTELEVAEGLLAIGLVLLLSFEAKSIGFGPMLDSPLLNKRLKPPFSYLFAILGTVGALSFLVLGLCDTKRVCEVIDTGGLDVVQYPLRVLGRFDGAAYGPGGAIGYGTLGLLTWVGAVVLLTLGEWFARALKLFAVPSLLFLTVVVFLFDPGDMGNHALNLVSGLTLGGMPLLSNWSLLTISLFFTAYALVHDVRRSARGGADRPSPATGTGAGLLVEEGPSQGPGGIQKNRDE